MEFIKSPDPFSLIGKEVTERYGRYKARIIALELNDNGEAENIVIENNGVILFKEIGSLLPLSDNMYIDEADRVASLKHLNECNYFKLQIDAINRLANTTFSKDRLEMLIKKVSSAYAKWKDEVVKNLKKLEKRREKILNKKERIKKLLSWLTHWKNAGLISEKIYTTSCELLKREDNKLNSELESTELIIAGLSLKIRNLDNEFNAIKSILRTQSLISSASW
ncbi:MAG: hypothetical protein QXH96_00365 [Candidatus Geothermarchaeota archaeon]